MNLRKNLFGAGAFAVLFSASGASLAMPILVDFEPSASVTETGFSSASSSPTVISGVTFTFGGALFDRNTVADSGAFTYADLYRDFAYTNGASSAAAPAINLGISGLAANTSYDIRFYSSDFFTGCCVWATTVKTSYTPTTGSGAALSSTFDRTANPTSNLQDSAVGSFTTDGSGALAFSIVGVSLDNGNSFTRLNGLEIDTTRVVPAPATLALLGLGLLGFGARGRTRRKG